MTNQYSLVELFHFMESGRLVVPKFQRGFVWPKKSVLRLFDSINRSLPIGILMAVEAEGEQFSLASTDSSLFPAPAERAVPFSRRLWLIDGAQRMAALYNGLFASKSQFRLLYDLSFREFLFAGKNKKGDLQMEMSILFNSKELMAFQARLGKGSGGEDLLVEVNAIRDRFYHYMVPVMIIADVQASDLVEIFTRLNTSGTALTKKEIEKATKYGSED